MSEFPKLMWLPDGREITVRSQDEQDLKVSEGARLSVNAITDPVLAPEPDEVDAAADDADEEAETPKKRGKK